MQVRDPLNFRNLKRIQKGRDTEIKAELLNHPEANSFWMNTGSVEISSVDKSRLESIEDIIRLIMIFTKCHWTARQKVENVSTFSSALKFL